MNQQESIPTIHKGIDAKRGTSDLTLAPLRKREVRQVHFSSFKEMKDNKLEEEM